MVFTKTVEDPKPDLEDVVAVSDDNEMDYRHLFNDDDKPNLNKVKMKVVVNRRSGKKVKVEKYWWTLDMDARARREVREKEREQKDRLQKDAQASMMVANERAIHSDAKLNLLESKVKMLVSKLVLRS